jgi:hypothetical protein
MDSPGGRSWARTNRRPCGPRIMQFEMGAGAPACTHISTRSGKIGRSELANSLENTARPAGARSSPAACRRAVCQGAAAPQVKDDLRTLRHDLLGLARVTRGARPPLWARRVATPSLFEPQHTGLSQEFPTPSTRPAYPAFQVPCGSPSRRPAPQAGAPSPISNRRVRGG